MAKYGKRKDAVVEIFIDNTDPENPKVLTDEEEKVLNKTALPPHIVKETSTWRFPSWGLQQLIIKNSVSMDNHGEIQFDISRSFQARIRVLLTGWSLENPLPNIEAPELPGVKILTDAAMTEIRELPRDIVQRMLDRASAILYPEERAKNA